MANQKQTNTSKSQSDEIDLGQLFQIIGNFFESIFRRFLRFFLFIKRNIYMLLGLGVLGVAAGFGLKQITSEKMKTEVIVRPNIESKDYLYDVVAEVQANIKAENHTFFDSLKIDIDELKGFEVAIETLGNKGSKLEDELKYLELLKGMDISREVSDVIKDEVLSRNSLNLKISFFYQEDTKGHESAKKIMEYINSNPYFNELISIYISNAKKRIEKNEVLIKQLDELITQYTINLKSDNNQNSDGKIVLSDEQEMNLPALFALKNDLIRDIENKNVELKTRENAIKVINFGTPQEVKIPFFGKTPVLIPLVLIGMFFIFSVLKYLDKKASELQ
jgi:hypothetical protein